MCDVSSTVGITRCYKREGFYAFIKYVNDIDIRVDNVRPDENWVTTEAHSVQLS